MKKLYEDNGVNAILSQHKLFDESIYEAGANEEVQLWYRVGNQFQIECDREAFVRDGSTLMD